MGKWDSLGNNVKKSTREWLSWAQQHARELGDAGLRHIERQDLLTERQRLYTVLGEGVAAAFIDEDKKTLRSTSAAIADILDRLREINARIETLDREGDESTDTPDEKNVNTDEGQRDNT